MSSPASGHRPRRERPGRGHDRLDRRDDVAKLAERINRFSNEVVAGAVMAALRDARTTAAGLAREIAIETMGPDSLSARTIDNDRSWTSPIEV